MMTVDSGRVSVKSQVLGLQTYVVNGLDGEVMDDMERGPSGGQSNETSRVPRPNGPCLLFY